MIKINQNYIKQLEQKLIEEAEMIETVYSWYETQLSYALARLNSAANKLNETMDDAWIPKIEQYQKELENLQLKAGWEEKTIENFNKKQRKFNQLKERMVLNQLSAKLRKVK